MPHQSPPADPPLVDLVARLTGRTAARSLVARYGHAYGMACATSEELYAVPGLGATEGGRVAAAFELGRRALSPPWDHEEPFCAPEDVWAHYRGRLAHLQREVVYAVGLDARCRKIVEFRLAEGGLDRCPVEPADLFRPLLRTLARSVILVHNHPSGDPTPSTADLRTTRRLAMAGQLIGIAVVDHVVVGRTGYRSMADDGALA